MPYLIRLFSPKYWICELVTTGKIIFLTFDDGPIPETTPEILTILKEHQATATFFCVGDNVRKHPEIFTMIREEGHSIGNHSFSHLNGWKTPPGGFVENVNRCKEYFETNLFRPPYGSFTLSQYLLLRKEFRFILWSVLTWDFASDTTPEQCLRYAIDNTRSGSIVVFHDSVKTIDNVRYALPRFLDHFQSQGYRFEGINI